MNALFRFLTWTGLVLGSATLALQASLSIPSSMAHGAGFATALALFASYLTIVTHSALVLVYLSALTQWPGLAIFRHPVTRGLMAGVVLLVMLYYHFVLLGQKRWDGLWMPADISLHYVLPLIYLTWWSAMQNHGRLGWRDLPLMLLPPLVYLPYALTIGGLTGSYPYAILNLGKLGAAQVALNVAEVTFGLAVLDALVVVADKALRARIPDRAGTR